MELKVAQSGHLNNLVCVDFHEFHWVLAVGELLNITHSNKLNIWIKVIFISATFFVLFAFLNFYHLWTFWSYDFVYSLFFFNYLKLGTFARNVGKIFK